MTAPSLPVPIPVPVPFREVLPDLPQHHLHFIEGDACELLVDAVIHIEGAECADGRTTDAILAEKYPDVIENFLRRALTLGDAHVNRVWMSKLASTRPRMVFHFPTLPEWYDDPPLSTITRLADELVRQLYQHHVTTAAVYSPALKGVLTKEFIAGYLSEILEGSGLELYICTDPRKTKATS